MWLASGMKNFDDLVTYFVTTNIASLCIYVCLQCYFAQLNQVKSVWNFRIRGIANDTVHGGIQKVWLFFPEHKNGTLCCHDSPNTNTKRHTTINQFWRRVSHIDGNKCNYLLILLFPWQYQHILDEKNCHINR